MPQFAANPQRLDPYKNFKFQVVLDGNIVPGVTRVGALIRHTQTINHRDGNFPSHLMSAPGATSFDPIILERGVTHDTTFEDWAMLAYNPSGDADMSLKDFRKDMRINLLNQQGTIVLSYIVHRCWVTEYQALDELDANEPSVVNETLVIQHEGFERDQGVKEPVES